MRRCALFYVALLRVTTGVAGLWFETGMLSCRAVCVLLTELLDERRGTVPKAPPPIQVREHHVCEVPGDLESFQSISLVAT